jgi:hypothetical protein
MLSHNSGLLVKLSHGRGIKEADWIWPSVLVLQRKVSVIHVSRNGGHAKALLIY